MAKYWLVFKLSLLQLLEYRLDLFLGTFRYAASIMLLALLWMAVAKESTAFIDTRYLLQYYVAAAILYGLSNFHLDEVEEDIRLGYISKYLVKPISPFLFYFINSGTKTFAEVVIKAFVMIPIAALLGVSFGTSLANLFIFFCFMPVIFFGMFSLYLVATSLAFWFTSVDSIRLSIMFVFRFLSGIFIPILFMPEWFQYISRWLPFTPVAFTPIQVLLNKLDFSQSLLAFGVLLFWSLLFFALQQFLWRKATHSYEATGI